MSEILDIYVTNSAYSSADLVDDVASICTFCRICYDDFQVWLLVEDLLDSAVVAAPGRDWPGLCLRLIVFVPVVILGM